MNSDFRFTYSEDKLNGYFGESIIFPYINNLKLLSDYIDKENRWKKVLPILGERLKITSLINELLGFSLLSLPTAKKGLVEELIEVFQRKQGNEIVFEWFDKKSSSLKNNGEYFDNVADNYSTKHSLFKKDSKINSKHSIDNKFIIVEGPICLKEALNINGQLFDSLKKSKNEWVMCNFPPEGMVLDNPEYSPDCLLLEFDKNFLEVFGKMIPFIKKIGWFAKCTIGGFFDQKAQTYLNYPVLKVSIIKLEKPKHPDKIVDGLIGFLIDEFERPNYLEKLHSRIYLYYFVLEMFNGWDIDYKNVDNDLKVILSKYFEKDKNRVSTQLQKSIGELIN